MTTLSIQPPYPIITGADGQPLEDGYIWIGAANLNPQTNPIAVYWDAALTQPAAQPVRTQGGYPVNAGTPARLYVGSDYSVLVQDKRGSTVYSAPAATERYSDPVITGVSSAEVSFLQAGAGAQPRTVQSKQRDVVSVRDFGAVGNGIADDTVAIQAAIDAAPTQGSVTFESGVYIIGGTVNLKSNILVDGRGATIKAKDATNFEHMLLASSKVNIQIKDIRLNANKAGRSAGQNIRFMGLTFENCDDCVASNVYVENTRGYNSIPAVGIAIGGTSIRCKIENCTAANCGDSGANISDGYFASGESNLIIGSLAVNCTDTGFVIESSNCSGIVGCIARSCSAGAAITNAVNDHKYGNFISGISILDWNSSVTGGIQIGCPLNTSAGFLYDTVVSDVTIVAVAAGSGVGPAINIRKTGTPKTVRLTLNNVRIRGASTQGIVVDGDQVSIRGCDISGATSSCIQFQAGSANNFVSGCSLFGGVFGITSAGNASVVAEANYFQSQSSWGIYASDTSTITSMFNVIKNPGVNFIGKDVGATLELVGSQGNTLAVNNAAGAATTGTIIDKFVVSDRNGNPLGFVPVYNT